jgi:hypothetical protein
MIPPAIGLRVGGEAAVAERAGQLRQAEADRLLASRREMLVSTETFVLRHRPDLSRAAVASTTSSRP